LNQRQKLKGPIGFGRVLPEELKGRGKETAPRPNLSQPRRGATGNRINMASPSSTIPKREEGGIRTKKSQRKITTPPAGLAVSIYVRGGESKNRRS